MQENPSPQRLRHKHDVGKHRAQQKLMHRLYRVAVHEREHTRGDKYRIGVIALSRRRVQNDAAHQKLFGKRRKHRKQ